MARVGQQGPGQFVIVLPLPGLRELLESISKPGALKEDQVKAWYEAAFIKNATSAQVNLDSQGGELQAIESGPAAIDADALENRHEVGVATGLAWTAAGGATDLAAVPALARQPPGPAAVARLGREVVLEAVRKHGSLRAAARALECQYNNVHSSMIALQRRAALRGYSPSHDMTRPAPEGYIVRTYEGTSWALTDFTWHLFVFGTTDT